MKLEFSSPRAPVELLEDEIRDYAYHLYEQSGRVPGRDLDNWLEAKACILANIPRHQSNRRLRHHFASVR